MTYDAYKTRSPDDGDPLEHPTEEDERAEAWEYWHERAWKAENEIERLRKRESSNMSEPAHQMQVIEPVALTPMDMIGRAVASGASIEVLEKLMGLQERWDTNQERKAFDAAIAAAKAEIPVIMKNRKVDFTSAKGRTNYQYEDLAEIARTIDPILSKHGLSYRFRTAVDNGMVTVTCIISHKLGHSEENSLPGPVDNSGNKNSVQAIGSTCTYLQRYTLKAALGLSASNDDDGYGGNGKPPNGGSDYITADQVAELTKLLKDAGRTVDQFCKYAGIDKLGELYASRYEAAVAAVKRTASGKAS